MILLYIIELYRKNESVQNNYLERMGRKRKIRKTPNIDSQRVPMQGRKHTIYVPQEKTTTTRNIHA